MQGECFGKQVSRANEQKGLADNIIQVHVLVLKFQGHVQALRSFVDFEWNSLKKNPNVPPKKHILVLRGQMFHLTSGQ